MRRILPYVLGLLIWLPGRVPAQRVIYSASFNTRSDTHLQVIGKSENFYWVEKLRKQKSFNRRVADISEIQSFGLLDAKLNLLREEVQVTHLQGSLKQWLVANDKGLDQVILARDGRKIKILCSRFKVNENSDNRPRLIDSLPFSAGPSNFLLVRSEDHSKILLIAFENTDEEITRVHALLFDTDWNLIYHQVISHKLFSIPCIQEEEIGFPAESFDNLPIKLANNGEWLMASPSRISRNFSLFHACANGSDYYFREIPVSAYYKMEDIAMSIDNDQEKMSVGLLSGYLNTSFKNVQICNYSMKQGRFDFDSSFRFNTQVRDVRSKNLSHESFIAVPGAGYMLLKEYGSPVELNKPPAPFINDWETAYLLANYSGSNTTGGQIKDGYTLNRGLSPIPSVRNRGDLNLFYFPALTRDSTWSAVLDMEQHAESNNPDLSYLLIPVKNKLYIVYNSLDGFADPQATTTTLNMHGQATDDALIFWKMNRMLNFQQSHRISAGEIAVPYLDSQQAGFAIIKLR